MAIQTFKQNGIVVDVSDLAASNKKSAIRVLHVDDDPSLQEITKLMLLDLNSSFEIDHACCVDEAFKKLSTGQYDVVVSDYEMPQKSGLQFLKELREQKNNIPFILFTGKGREEIAIKALNLGADGYYNKQGGPVTVYGELAHTIVLSVQRANAKSMLEQSELHYRNLYEKSPMAYHSLDGNGRFIVVNNAWLDLFGYSREEVIGHWFGDFLVSNQVELFRERFHVFKADGKIQTEVKMIKKDGSIALVEFDGVIGKDIMGNFKQTHCVLKDITENREADLELRKWLETFESVGEGVDAGLAIIDRDYNVVWANKRLMALGVAPNKKCYETFSNIGKVCPDCGVERIFKQNVSLDIHEYKTVDSKGETVWIELRVTPLKDKDGNVNGALELAVDITERKKAEAHRKVLEVKLDEYSKHLKCMVDLRTVQLKDANERLVKSERLAAIGELAGMVGQDLRNPIAGIKNAAYYLKKKGTTISETQNKEMLETIEKAIEHSDKIINDLLDYSREMRLELTKHAAHTLVDEALRMIQVPNRIQIINHVQEDTLIWVNSDKLMQVFVNLIKNAIDAIPENGTLGISSCQTKDCVEISFADTGIGIPEETLKKLFTPLFTTKAQGMGFGLAICKRIVEAHEGKITVETAVNKGTTFTVTLPLKPNAKVECKKTCR